MTAVWRRGDEVFAEVRAGHEISEQTGDFGIHPALLDAAMHALLLVGEPGQTLLPFSWEEVTLHSHGASALRVRLVALPSGQVVIDAADEHGHPVLSVRSLQSRPVSAEQLAAAGATTTLEGLLELVWSPIPVPTIGGASTVLWNDIIDGDDQPLTADAVIVDYRHRETGTDLLTWTHHCTHHALGVLQAWLSHERFSATTLMVLTNHAVTISDDDHPVDPASAALWGLVRSAQTEDPGRIILIDTDSAASDPAASINPAAVLACNQPQLAIRNDTIHRARLSRISAPEPTTAPTPLGADDVVLITGGTGGLGAVLAQHLVTQRGVRRLILVSRRGPAASGATELAHDLGQHGAHVDILACDVSDPAATHTLITNHPDLTAIIHAAGLLDDGIITSLTPQRIDTVLAAKADAAWHLHQATQHLNLTTFTLYSSEAGILGGPGQGNYAAANTFLDGLAAHRRGHGLPAQSIAWGLWAQSSSMTDHLSTTDRARLEHTGMIALSNQDALHLFDLTIDHHLGNVIAGRFDISALRTHAATGNLHPLLQDLIPTTGKPATTHTHLRTTLTGLDPAGQHRVLTDLVSPKQHWSSATKQQPSIPRAHSKTWDSTHSAPWNSATDCAAPPH